MQLLIEDQKKYGMELRPLSRLPINQVKERKEIICKENYLQIKKSASNYTKFIMNHQGEQQWQAIIKELGKV